MKCQQGMWAENIVRWSKVNFTLKKDSFILTRLWSVLNFTGSLPPLFDSFMKTVLTPREIHTVVCNASNVSKQ